MSGRFVRASKFRHVHGNATRKDKCFNGIKVLTNGDSEFAAANSKFVSYATLGGGGPVVVLKMDANGRIASHPPTVNVHKSKVWDIKFSPFMPNILATASDDCTAKITNIPDDFDGDLKEAIATLSGHQKKVTYLAWNTNAPHVLATGSYDHTVKIWDVEAQEAVHTLEFADSSSHIAWDSHGKLLGANCRDKKFYIQDPRQEGTAMSGDACGGAKPGRIVFMDELGYIANIGHNARSTRQIKLFDARKLDSALHTQDLDQSAGALLAHFDEDTGVLFVGGKGDGNIRYFEITKEAPYVHYLSEFRSVAPQKGVCFLPKRCVDVTKCEIASAIRVMRDYLEPVSFVVPRKSDLFQEDIFPESFLDEPGLTKEEWLAGENKPRPKGSMKPGAVDSSSSGAQMKVQKSPAQLREELAAANARIKELEAEVAKLKAQ